MQHRVEIGKRLKELRKKYNYSQSYVAGNLFISQAAYSLIENSQNGIVSDHVIGLSNLYEVTTDFILKGDKMLVRISPSEGFIPYIKIKAHAGYIKNFPGDLDTIDTEWYKIPAYNPTIDHRLFEIEGNSMVPTIFPGDIVICQKQRDWGKILDGSLVLLVTRDFLLIKRIKSGKDPETFLFENDNPEEDEVMDFRKDDIVEINMVRGKISNALVAHHPLIANREFKNLEESVEFLKKELYSITKRLNSGKN